MKLVKLVTPVAIAILLLAISCVGPAETPGIPTPTPTPAEFEVVSLRVLPAEMTTGETATVEAKVKNTGDSEGVYTAVLTVAGAEVEKKEISVAAGATETVTFSLVVSEAGTYKIAIGDLSSSLTVVGKTPVTYELKYDDGTSEGFCSCGGRRGYLVGFSPMVTPFSISEIRLFASLVGTGYEQTKPELEIWNKDSNVQHICEVPYTRFSLEPSWVTAEIPSITVNDDFCVVFYTNSTSEGGAYIHFDSSVINKHSELVADGQITNWFHKPPKETTNWMIRVVGTSAEEGTAATPPPPKTSYTAEFREKLSSLDTPQKLSQWMLNNINLESHYERWKETGVNYIAPPEETFENRVGCCAEFAVFACYVLRYHGYDAKILRIAVESNPSKNHAVCVYPSSGSLYTINVGRIEGPFQTYEDIAFDHDKDWSEYDVYYSWEKFQQTRPPDKVIHRKQ